MTRLSLRLRAAASRLTRAALGATLGLGLTLAVVDRAAFAGEVAPVAPAAAAPSTGPALWVVKDEDSTIYLFGTVHLLRPDTIWRTPAFDAALAASDEVYLEITEIDQPEVMQPLVMRYGMAAEGQGLSTYLDDQDEGRLDAAARSVGATGAAFEPMRPWLAAMQVTVAGVVKSGYDPTSGVDLRILSAAKEAGKPVKGLETAEQQLQFFSTLPDEVQVDFLRQSLESFENGADLLDAIVTGWSAGDVASIEANIIDEMKEWGSLYDILLVRRNTDWADQIETMLEGSGTTFIAVGAGHLVGDDSVQEILQDRGVVAVRQ